MTVPITVNALVLRVARAICKSASCQGAACCQHPANRGADCAAWDGRYNDAAVAALEAFREYLRLAAYSPVEALQPVRKFLRRS